MRDRRGTRQSDEARESAAEALHAAFGPEKPSWDRLARAEKERYRQGVDAAQLFDSRADTWSHIHRVRQLLDVAVLKLIKRGQEHDQTKLRSPERETFDVVTPRLRETTFGSPEYRDGLGEMAGALAHHYEHNTHHPEHWPNGIKDMSLLDVLEMLCDWKAASERHADGDIVRSVEVNCSRFGISTQLRSLLENTAREMGWIRSFVEVAAERVREGGTFTAAEVQRLRADPAVASIDTIPGRSLSGANCFYVTAIRMAHGGDLSEAA